MSGQIIAGIMLIITVSMFILNPDIQDMMNGLAQSNWIQQAFNAFKGA